MRGCLGGPGRIGEDPQEEKDLMRIWYLHALTPAQIGSFYSYRMACKEKRHLWQVELKKELEREKSKIVSPEEMWDLVCARRLLGERILSDVPLFEQGDGVNYKGTPGTVIKVEKSKVYVRLDEWHRIKTATGHRILFEPSSDGIEDGRGVHVFTQRKDSQYRLSGVRSSATLGLGRYVGKW